MHLANGVDQIGQAFQRKVFTLHGHDHAMRCAQAVEREQRQRRRAVNQDEVVVVLDLGQRQLQALFAAVLGDQFHFGASQFAVGTEHVIAALLGRASCFLDAAFLQQYVVHAGVQIALVEVGSHGGIALRIQIDQQHALPDLGQSCRQVDGGGGFADTSLLVGDTKDSGHAVCFRLWSKPLHCTFSKMRECYLTNGLASECFSLDSAHARFAHEIAEPREKHSEAMGR